jgi:predicted AAA+ superfamily ATPase
LQDEKITYWRLNNGYEVDCIIGDARVAIEVKSCEEVKSMHTKGLNAFLEEFPDCKPLIVSLNRRRRILNGIEIIPVREFLVDLWQDKFK